MTLLDRTRRLLLVAVGCGLGIAVLNAPAAAQTTGQPTTYKVNVTEVALCTSSACSDPVVVGTGASQFDIASAGVGAQVGQYASAGATVPPGDYTHLRVQMTRTIGMTASIFLAGAGLNCDSFTGAAAAAAPFSGALNGRIPPAGPATEASFRVPDVGSVGGASPTEAEYAANGITLLGPNSMQIIQALGSTLSLVAGDTAPEVFVNFGTSTAAGAVLTGGGPTCVMFPQPPVITVNFG